MNRVYVEKKKGGYWIKETRISLDSIVYAFNRGESPESILGSFPLLTLEEIYGALTFYLANKEEIDANLAESERRFKKDAETNRGKLKASNPALFERLGKAKTFTR